jgi:hypothetical protein
MEGQENNNIHTPSVTTAADVPPELRTPTTAVEPAVIQPPAPDASEGVHEVLGGLPEDTLSDAAAPAQEDTELKVEETPKRLPQADTTTVKQEQAVFIPLGVAFDVNGITLAVPGAREDELQEALAKMPNTDLGATAEGREWIAVAQAGYRNATPRKMLTDLDVREGSLWEQAVKSERGGIQASRPKQADTAGVSLRGEAGVLAVRQEVGLGGIIRIPLWHSGFHITLKTPGDAAILELERRITDEKVLLGRMTNGMLFSNTSVFIAEYLTEFAIRHLYDTSLRNKENIFSKIVSHDIQHLAWGLATAIWPTGFQYVRSVLGETDAQNKVVKDKIAIGKLQFTDTSQLSKWQINHMTSVTTGSMTDDSIKKYREEFLNQTPRKVQVTDKVAITLKVPTLAEHIASGQKWVNGIVVMTDQVFGMEQDVDERNRFIYEQGQATYMRQYGHWIESIELSNGAIVEDSETIDQTIDALSADDTIRNKFVDAVVKYIEDTTVSMIAVPTVAASEEQKYPRWPRLLPIDAMATFFTLLDQKVSQIRARS